MGLSDGAFFMIKHTPLPNGNHPISSPICPMGVADTLEPLVELLHHYEYMILHLVPASLGFRLYVKQDSPLTNPCNSGFLHA